MKTYLDGKRDNKKGFTLIELLVVIGIIGILSSIVLVSLQTSRKKALDAAVQQELVGLRSAVELYALNHDGRYVYSFPSPIPNGAISYGCSLSGVTWYVTDPMISPIILKIKGMSPGVACAIDASNARWAVAARLPSGSAISANYTWWCVDGYTVSRQSIGATPIDMGSPATPYPDAKCK